jgi:hypothetical protein
MGIHDLSEPARRAIDTVAASLAGVALFGLLQKIAVVVTILAGIGSISLVALRWYDRLKFGRLKGD